MHAITLVTGNPHKLTELQKVFPPSLQLTSRKLDLDEIQSLDLHEIVRHKLHQAYAHIKAPVIVEDVSAQLEKLNGLPGPFVKFFEQQLGKGALHTLAGEGRITVVCAMGYYDGTTEHIVDGVLEGRVVAPRDGEGFGFDYVIIPDGYDKTMSELGLETKNRISHRSQAAAQLARLLPQQA
jgi:inosine triphosphate pyrophosphatase